MGVKTIFRYATKIANLLIKITTNIFNISTVKASS